MVDKLRALIVAYLAAHPSCVITSGGSGGPQAVPVRCRSVGLAIDCLLPNWTDTSYQLEQDPRALLLFQDPEAGGLRWLQCRGHARRLDSPDWGQWGMGRVPAESPEILGTLYHVVRVTPDRIDLVDERRGWGVRDTLDL